MSLRCARCGSIWPDELEATWGTTRETSGYGAEPKCVAIVEDPRTKAGQVCAGRLRDSTAAVTEELHNLSGELLA